MRESAVPQRTSSPSAEVRWERPQASRTIASRRVVLPAAFGPTISCGPGPNATSSAAYDRSPAIDRRLRSGRTGSPTCGRASSEPIRRSPRSEAELREAIGPRISGRGPERHDDVDVAIIADRLEDSRRQRPVQLQSELLGIHLLENGPQEPGVESDRRPLALRP